MNIEAIDRRVAAMKVRIGEVPDPEMEPRPKIRRELRAQHNRLQAELLHLWNRRNRLQNLQKKYTRFETMRRQLTDAIEVLETRRNAAETDLANAKRRSANPVDHRRQENDLAEVEALIACVNGGWHTPGMSNHLPMALLRVLPSDFDVQHARPLRSLDVILERLDDERAKILAGLPAA